jgi:hypothetical protein
MEKEEITPAAAEVAAGEVKNNITDIKIKRSGFYKHPGRDDKELPQKGHIWYLFSFVKNGVPYKNGHIQITLVCEKQLGGEAGVKQYIKETYCK